MKNISGKTKSKNILGIIGPSGAGKSTFLDILANRKRTSGLDGMIKVDGKPIKNIKYISSYVMQEEVYLGSLTVKENI